MSNKPQTTHIALDRGWGPTPSDVHRFLEEKDCFDSYNKLAVMDLFSMVSLKEKVQIKGEMVYAGWTCSVSIPGLARRNGMSKRKMYYCINELEKKGAIEKQSPTNDALYQFRVMVYPPALERFEQNPDRDKIDMSTPTPDAKERQRIQEEASSDFDDNDLVHDMHQESDASACHAPLQEVEDLQKPPPTVSSKSTGTREAEEKTGVVINNEEQKAEEKEKASLGEKQGGVDFVPTKQIGEILENLTEGGDTPNTTPELESFMEIYKPNDGVVWTWKDIEPAQLLHDTLTKALQANHLRIPTNAFFKRAIEEMNARIADGRLPNTPPNSFNYFIKHSHGTDLIDYTLKLLKTEVSSKRSVAQTNSYLDDLKQRRTDHKETPEVQAGIDKMLGRGDITDEQRQAQAHFARGISLRKRVNHVGAHELFKKAYELDPTDEHKEWLDKSIQDMHSA